MALVDKTFSEVIAFTRPASAPYVNSSGQTVTAGVNVPRLTHTTSGQPLGLLLESERQERAVIRNGNWRTPNRGTWVVRGDFDSSIILSGLGFYVEADGEGTIVITYSLSGSKVFSRGRLQYESAMRPTEEFNILDEERAVIARMEFIPAMLGDNEAAAMATGSVDVRLPLTGLWAGGNKGFLWSSLPYYQDPAGATPATLGDPVGLIEDATDNNADMTQATVTARPILGRVPVGGRRNVINNSEGFSSSLWQKFGQEILGDGKLVKTTGSGSNYLVATVANVTQGFVSGEVWAISFWAEASEDTSWIQISGAATVFGNLVWANFNISTGVIGNKGASTEAFIAPYEGGYKCSIVATVITSAPLSGGGQLSLTNNTDTPLRVPSYAGDGVSGIYPRRAQLERVSPTNYQKVVSRFNITETGVESVYYLRFDGTDDSVSTTLPAITNGTVVIAGTNGIWIDDDFNHAGGTFTIGTDTYTNGPSGILGVVGDLIVGGCFVIDRQLAAEERTRVIAKLKSMGSGEVIV